MQAGEPGQTRALRDGRPGLGGNNGSRRATRPGKGRMTMSGVHESRPPDDRVPGKKFNKTYPKDADAPASNIAAVCCNNLNTEDNQYDDVTPNGKYRTFLVKIPDDLELKC
jgi:hypothetical protein